MKAIVQLNSKDENKESFAQMPGKLRALFEERKKAKREPLTPEKLRNTPGLESLSDQEATEAIDSIKKLAALFFEMACQNEPTCIDNQQVVYLGQENKAA